MSKINDTLAKLEFAQIGWVVPDIKATVLFLGRSLGVSFRSHTVIARRN